MNINFDFNNKFCFIKHKKNGFFSLSRLPKTTTDAFAFTPLNISIKKGIKYVFRTTIKLNTGASIFEFLFLDKNLEHQQIVSSSRLSISSMNKWLFIECEITPDSDEYVYLGFSSGLLNGINNYISIYSLSIEEKNLFTSTDIINRLNEVTTNNNVINTKNISVINSINSSLHSEIDQVKKSLVLLEKKINQVNNDVNVNYQREQFIYWNDKASSDETTLDAKKRFFLGLKKEDENLFYLQKATVLLLSEFGRICSKYDIPYWLDFGTLIGAVRHHGFIPWDDDIDVGMIRKDIDFLEECMKKENTYIQLSKYFCADRDTCNIVRIIFNDTSIKIFVDIFIYDFCDTENMDETWKLNLSNRRKFSMGMLKYKQIRNDPSLNHWENRMIDNPEHIAIINSELRKMNEELNVKLDTGNAIMWGIDNVSVFANKPGGIVEYDRIFPLKRMLFEGQEYNIPNQYEEQLRCRYGDIYSLPKDMNSHAHVSRSPDMIQKCKDIVELLNSKSD